MNIPLLLPFQLTKKMKQIQRSMFTVSPHVDKVHPSILSHAKSTYAKSVAIQNGKFKYFDGTNFVLSGGVVNAVADRYYSHYKTESKKAKRRRSKTTKIKGSSKLQGKMVHAQIQQALASKCGYFVKRKSKLTDALLKHWKSIGHVGQASELPARISKWKKMTQADYITKDPLGQLWLWEIKTGMPIGATRKHGKLSNELSDVDCTKFATWQLQLHFTRQALEDAGIPIAQSRVIQVYTKRDEKDPIVKVHDPPAWLKKIKY